MSRYYSDHRPYGFTYHADIYCGECGATLPDIDPEGNEKQAIFSWDLNELATAGSQYCARCDLIENEWRPA